MVLPEKNQGALNYYNNIDDNNLIAFTRIFDSYINTVFVFFIAVRIDSCAIMYQFMVYQRGYRIEDLDITKDEFNRPSYSTKYQF